MPSVNKVTELLLAWNGGDRDAFDRLMPLVYAELHRAARRYLNREYAPRSLQTTDLVNEVYLRLIDAQQVDWRNRAQIYAISAQ
jgi:DNA-directed RNA polymerase specialized sigma24 family protein